MPAFVGFVFIKKGFVEVRFPVLIVVVKFDKPAACDGCEDSIHYLHAQRFVEPGGKPLPGDHAHLKTWLAAQGVDVERERDLKLLWFLMEKNEDGTVSLDDLVYSFTRLSGTARSMDMRLALQMLRKSGVASSTHSEFVSAQLGSSSEGFASMFDIARPSSSLNGNGGE